MTERLQFHFSLSCIEEGNGNPLQCSCLENTREQGNWWAAVCGVEQSYNADGKNTSAFLLIERDTAILLLLFFFYGAAAAAAKWRPIFKLSFISSDLFDQM